MWITITIAVLLAALAVGMIMQMRGRRIGGFSGGGAGYEQGTLTVTGVSDRPQPDSKGEVFCTVSGVINGPGTSPTEVYGTMVLTDGASWPQVGSDHPVVYRPGKAETSWRFGELPPVTPPPTSS
ncbi:hypothetical protein [Gordonia sp. NPDC003950]